MTCPVNRIPLSLEEKQFILDHSTKDLWWSHGDIARELGKLFRDHNGGTRHKRTVVNFRKSFL